MKKQDHKEDPYAGITDEECEEILPELKKDIDKLRSYLESFNDYSVDKEQTNVSLNLKIPQGIAEAIKNEEAQYHVEKINCSWQEFNKEFLKRWKIFEANRFE